MQFCRCPDNLRAEVDIEITAAPNSGIYVAVFFLSTNRRITIGRLGRFDFQRGFYFYVGSAQSSLLARLQRHARRQKALRWHIDYLSVKATMLGALTLMKPKAVECDLARILSKYYISPIRGFGSSDCGCESHLFYREKIF